MDTYDTYVTVPMFGYKSRDAYRQDVSSNDQLHKIRVPCLYVHSHDDAAVGPESVPFEEFARCDNLMLATMKSGGHCCFFAHGRLFGLLPTQWYRKPLSEYLKFIFKEVE